MTCKDYDLIAACLGGAYARYVGVSTASSQQITESAIDDVRRRLTLELMIDNPRFDEACFRAAITKWTTVHGGQ